MGEWKGKERATLLLCDEHLRVLGKLELSVTS